MAYPIKIAVSTTGTPIIGAREIKYYDIADTEKVFGSQLPYRIVAVTPDGYKIMTATAAKRSGYRVLASFLS